MTIAELKAYYGLPEKILNEYLAEFLANTPGTPEFESARSSWDNSVVWATRWTGGAQDAPATFSVSAFSPPAPYTVNQTQQGAWMLERITNGSDRAYYQVNFSGFIDWRLGSFGIDIYPVLLQDNPFVLGMRFKIWAGRIDAWVNRAEFRGLFSMAAQHENGMNIILDYSRVKAALAYLNAMSKFQTELRVTADLARQKAQSEIKRVNFDLSERLRRESSDLAQKKLALLVAIDNDEKSKIRDMQNMLLTVQSIRLK